MAAPVGRGVDPDDAVDGVVVRRGAVGSDAGVRTAVARIPGVDAEAGSGHVAARRHRLRILFFARVVVDGCDIPRTAAGDRGAGVRFFVAVPEERETRAEPAGGGAALAANGQIEPRGFALFLLTSIAVLARVAEDAANREADVIVFALVDLAGGGTRRHR